MDEEVLFARLEIGERQRFDNGPLGCGVQTTQLGRFGGSEVPNHESSILDEVNE